jgi:serine protease AprX
MKATGSINGKGQTMGFPSKFIAAILLTTGILSNPALYGQSKPNLSALQSKPVILEKPSRAISSEAKKYLTALKTPTVPVWVYFNDKGIYTPAAFANAAAEIKINSHARERRTKAGYDKVVYADLAVPKDYIDRITSMGARLRRISRWLNAASFNVDPALLEDIGKLGFVNRIEPVAAYSGEKEIEAGNPPDLRGFLPSKTDALDYGTSWWQIQMTKANELHSLGYTGQGIIVAMLDTGYRKSHAAFAKAASEGRILAEHDFIFDDDETQNEPEDDPGQHFHGTYCWSTLGGFAPGEVIGPAYGASFVLAKTEDIRSETPIEEDNWVAAFEWADSLGTDVISSSLGYTAWYTYEDMDGNTAPTTLVANTAASLGIVVCNAVGNEGPGSGTLNTPSDAFNILACGAVDQYETLAYFSSCGPSYDGRIKPEVCAMGYNTYCANASDDNAYTYKSGTSLSTPLVGGASALLLSANPYLNAFQARKALMETATNAATPDNNYGWGIIDVMAAYNWGANFTADTTIAFDSLTVSFMDSSSVAVISRKWYFGDGDSTTDPNPVHKYIEPGSYDVTLIVESAEDGTLTRVKENFIAVLADTLTFEPAFAPPGDTAVMSVVLSNTQPLTDIVIPVKYSPPPQMSITRVSLGERTIDFDMLEELYRSDASGELVFRLVADTGSGASPLSAGSGEIAEIYFAIDENAAVGQHADIYSPTIDGYDPQLANRQISYNPRIKPGIVAVPATLRGDANSSGVINILDVTYLINFLYKNGPAPYTLYSGDANADETINILDITYLINYLYKDGPPPPEK